MLIEINGDVNKLTYDETMSLVDIGSLRISVDRRQALLAVLSGIQLSKLGLLAATLVFLFTGIAVMLALFGDWQLSLVSYSGVLGCLWLLRTECAKSVYRATRESKMAFLELRQEGFIEVVANVKAAA